MNRTAPRSQLRCPDHIDAPLRQYLRDQLCAADAVTRNWTTANMAACPPAIRNTVSALVMAHCRLAFAVDKTGRLPQYRSRLPKRR